MLVLLTTNFYTELGLSLEKSLIARLNEDMDMYFLLYKLAVSCQDCEVE